MKGEKGEKINVMGKTDGWTGEKSIKRENREKE